MPPTHNSQIETSVSRLNETAYGVARLSSDDFRRIIGTTPGVIDLDTEFADDAGQETGSDLAENMWATKSNSGAQIPTDFCFQDVGYFLMDILGGYAVATVDTGLYQHTFTPQSMNTSRQMPSRTLMKKYGGLKIVLAPGGTLEQFTLSGGKDGRLQTSAQYRGSGDYDENPAGYSSPSLTSDREWGYAGQAKFRVNDDTIGTKQVETATAAGSVTGDGNAEILVTAAGMTGSPVQILFAVTTGDTAAVWAGKARTALKRNRNVNEFFEVSGTSTSIVLTSRVKAANDATMNIGLDNDTSTGITTASTSANTTPGVVGDNQAYSCDIESWSLSLNNPPAGDGHRQCSPYLVDGDPNSGTIKVEQLVGVRDYMFDFTCRLAASDKMRGWLKAGENLKLEIPIFGTDTTDASLYITHTKARVVSAKEIPDAGDGFIGITGQLKLMASSGAIPLTAVLINDVASYSS